MSRNPTRLTNIINDRYLIESKKSAFVSKNTVDDYIGYIEDVFLINKAQRYNLKVNNYIKSPYKYSSFHNINKICFFKNIF